MTTQQLNLPGTCRSDKKPKKIRRSEKAFQSQARAVLGTLGYSSLEAGQGRKEVECVCKKCNTVNRLTPTGWQGNTVGYPDLAFFRYQKFPGVGIFIELKGDATPIQPEQQRLADAGRSVICHSIEEVIQAVLAVELAMSEYQLPEARKKQIVDFLKMNAGRLD